MTDMTTKVAQGSKAKPANKAIDKAKAMAAQPSTTIQAASDDKVEPSALPDCAAVTLPDVATVNTPPAQSTEQATGNRDEPSEARPDEAVDSAAAKTVQLPKVAPPANYVKKLPKSALVQKLLSRARGATVAEMEEAMGWQAHSVRAFLTDLRKKGLVLVRETRKDGQSAYRIAA